MRRTTRSTTPAGRPPSGGTATVGPPCPRRSKPAAKSTIPKCGPPPGPPKKIDYKRPGMTKAMEQRLKHTQKLQEEMERKEREKREAAQTRRPKRCAAPPGGDARMTRRPATAGERGGPCRPGSSREPPPCPAREPPPCPAEPEPCPAPCPKRGARKSKEPAIPARTKNLAKSMNADIVQAEPLENGPIENLIIPPGAINAEKTTIVSIPQPAPEPVPTAQSTMHQASTSLNKSAAAISETLDEQDATEQCIVNSKLQELQQARRDFVMAAANLGGNSLLQDEEFPNLDVTPIQDITPPMMESPESPQPELIACPSLDDPSLQIEYGRYHPTVQSAREYLRSRRVPRRLDDEFRRVEYQPMDRIEDIEEPYDFDPCPGATAQLQRPLIDYGDDAGACEPLIQWGGQMIPRAADAYYYPPFQEDRLEKFLNPQRYPEPERRPSPRRPPPGRECLPEDLWDIDDPFYHEPPCPDLIDFRNC